MVGLPSLGVAFLDLEINPWPVGPFNGQAVENHQGPHSGFGVFFYAGTDDAFERERNGTQSEERLVDGIEGAEPFMTIDTDSEASEVCERFGAGAAVLDELTARWR